MAQVDLRKLAALQDYSNTELKILASVAPARDFPVAHVLCREGTAGASCFLLATGAVAVVKKTDEGEKTLATLRAGSIVGQMALVDRSPRSASLIAAEPTIALELTRDVFENLLHAFSPLALRFQEQIAIAGIRQLRMATQRLATLMGDQRAKQTAQAQLSKSETNSLHTIQAALSEWNMTMDDLDEVHVSLPQGQLGAGETRARTRL